MNPALQKAVEQVNEAARLARSIHPENVTPVVAGQLIKSIIMLADGVGAVAKSMEKTEEHLAEIEQSMEAQE